MWPTGKVRGKGGREEGTEGWTEGEREENGGSLCNDHISSHQ